MNIQIPIFLKIITFEKTLNVQKEINVIIVYQSKYAESARYAEEANEIINKANSNQYGGINFKPKLVNLDNTPMLNNLIDNNPSVIIIMPLKAVNISTISKKCKQYKILSFSTNPEYLEYGISVVLEERRNRPEIWINLNSVKNEGIEFSSQLLKLVKIKE